MNITLIVILGRRWHDGSNTYHSVSIIVHGTRPDGKAETAEGRIPFASGYEEHYVQTASEWLDYQGFVERKKYENGSTEPLWQFCRDRNITLIRNVVDVARKKDL